ncbi:MAG TPA: hypothetical protein VIS77_03100 [Burkholderiales bacterium]
MLAEVRRVLKPGGRFIAEIALGSLDEGGRGPGEYESTWWKRARDVTDAIARQGFTPGASQAFRFPWNGTQAVFRKDGPGVAPSAHHK